MISTRSEQQLCLEDVRNKHQWSCVADAKAKSNASGTVRSSGTHAAVPGRSSVRSGGESEERRQKAPRQRCARLQTGPPPPPALRCVLRTQKQRGVESASRERIGAWIWAGFGLDSGWIRARAGLGLDLRWIRAGFGLDSGWIRAGFGLNSS
eukprot:6173369-Pleurochrysis_carterae.AAC.1